MPVRLADVRLVQVRALGLVGLLFDEVTLRRVLIPELLVAGGAAGHHVAIGEDEVFRVLLAEGFGGHLGGGDHGVDRRVPAIAFRARGFLFSG